MAAELDVTARPYEVPMSEKSRIEGCLVRRHVEWSELVRALQGLLWVEDRDIGRLDMNEEAQRHQPVLVQWIEWASGFRLDLTFYIAASVSSRPSGIELASELARALNQEVLTSPPGPGMSSPACWILALPQGELHVVRQVNPESDDVEIDWRPEQMKNLRFPPRH